MSLTTCVATHAEEVDWAYRIADHSWKAVGNWREHAPSVNDDVIIDRNQNYTWIEPGTVASCRSLIIAKEKGNRGECRLIVKGGSLTINDGSLAIGLQSNAKGRVQLCDGTIQIKGSGACVAIGGNGAVVLCINGGRIDAGEVRIPAGNGKGVLKVHGGVVNCKTLLLGENKGTGSIDITEGKLVIAEIDLPVLDTYIAKGWITAYDGKGVVRISRDSSGKTVVTAKIDQGSPSSEDRIEIIESADIRVLYNLDRGWADFYWRGKKILSRFYSAIRLPDYITSKDYPQRTVRRDGTEVVVECSGGGHPKMTQRFNISADRLLLQTSVHGVNLKSNWIAPLETASPGAVDIGEAIDARALCVPFDNSQHTRYTAMPIDCAESGWGVGAFYDSVSRHGLVVGAVTHDTWKTGIEFSGSNNRLNVLCIYGGATMPLDVMTHAPLTGRQISSEIIFVGFFEDWRDGMEAFASANTEHISPLPLPTGNDGVPLGWKHYGKFGLGSRIDFDKARGISDFLKTELQSRSFHNERITLTTILGAGGEFQFKESEFFEFVNHCHKNGQKAGSYFCPFKIGGAPKKDLTQPVTNTDFTWDDIVLRDDEGNPIVDRNKYALDPTHPGTKQFIAARLDTYRKAGLDFLRLDFVELGALEGMHYRKGATGLQAYNEGMEFIADTVGDAMHINLAISPVFPYHYAHSRRISCDVNYSIQNSEYQLNSLGYGWWLERLYSSNDPGNVAFKPGGNTYEAITRVNAAAICSGQIVNVNDLTQPDQQALAKKYLTNPLLMELVRKGLCFRSVEGDSGSMAPDVFALSEHDLWHIAIFNYDTLKATKSISLERVGMAPEAVYESTDLWTGRRCNIRGSLTLELAGCESKIFTLQRSPESDPKI